MKCITMFIAGAVIAATSSAAFAGDWMANCTKVADSWMAAYNAGNADALANMYEPTKGTFSSMFWTATGHDVLDQAFKKDMASGAKFTSIKCDTSTQGSDGVESMGTWTATGKGPNGQDMAMSGHWQSFGVEENGKYLMVDHMGNMQLPPPK